MICHELFYARGICQEDSTKHVGHLVEQQVIIMDMKGLSLMPNSMALTVFRAILKIDQVRARGNTA